ncbi:MAG: hypothetical protein WAV56_02790 [Microgenomates group bacterium]
MNEEKLYDSESPEEKLVFLREKYFDKYCKFYEDLVEGQVRGRSTWTGNIDRLNSLFSFCEDLGLKAELAVFALAMKEKYPDWDGNFWQFANFGSGRMSGAMG